MDFVQVLFCITTDMYIILTKLIPQTQDPSPYLPGALLIFHNLNILVMTRPNNPDQAQPPDSIQINQLARPSQIQALRPRAHGHNQRHGAEPYNT